MSPTAVLLIAASVVLHVGWNAISKGVRPSPAFFLLASTVSSIALTPVLFWQRDVAGSLFVLVLPVLIPTGMFSAAYNVALARAYQSGDLSLVYPLARSLGPVGIALASVAIGRGAAIGTGCALGIALIALGSTCLPLERFGAFKLAHFRTPAFGFAVATAAATVGYTLLDDQALRMIRAAELRPDSTIAQSLVYAAMQAWATTLLLGLYVAVTPRERREVEAVLRTSAREAIAVAVFGYTAYILVLSAMAFVDDVTYVAAFRQLGVPLALVVGAVVLREPPRATRITGGALCTAGLLLIALG